jgi:flavin reductase (DIM6/NTAB) family NADH-FMN oxidoreductase RutF
VSGRKRQEFQDCGFTAAAACVVKVPLVEECPFNLECKVLRNVEFGDWVVVFGEIVETHVDVEKLDPQTGKIDMQEIDPLVYCATVREYWNLGSRLGFAFSAGKELAEKYDGTGGFGGP